ncbi:peptidase S8/S53 domain-containing protein [Terfezia claveryi]|nr:peptidase S8/S53 domain-containing protein [Terfezia claveryi]
MSPFLNSQTQTASKTPRKPKIDMALTTMHNFARCLETGIEDFCELSDFNLVPTTVAILDNGFNILDPAVKESLRDTPAMSFHPLDHEMLRSGMSTIAVGHPCHGTRMAYVVRQMCPLVKILPIRMRGSTVHDAPTFAGLDAASEAIEWVTELKPPPDIMCMSWTIKVPKTVKKDSVRQQIARLNSALQTADSKGIILFCATSDNGTHENPKRIYPGAIGMQRSAGSEVILRIGAANINGLDLYPGTPADFLFPGEDVPLGSDLGGYAIGSSVATANAAGFTALLLQLRKLSYAFNKSKSGFQHEATRLKTKSIANAFRTLGKEGESKIVSAFRQSVHFYEFEVDDETGDCFARGNTAILEEFIMKLLKKLGW